LVHAKYVINPGIHVTGEAEESVLGQLPEGEVDKTSWSSLECGLNHREQELGFGGVVHYSPEFHWA
jgi:hypothetical protein